jgi:hypothetical protein
MHAVMVLVALYSVLVHGGKYIYQKERKKFLNSSSGLCENFRWEVSVALSVAYIS